MQSLSTRRLRLRRFTLDDAPFVLRLVNEPSWLKYIGDKGVRDLDGACRYLQEGPLQMYDRHGFGLYAVELLESGTPIGMCGLIKRPTLNDVDIGFAFLPEYWGRGYAQEAAAASLALAKDTFHLERIVAITSPGNQASIRLLEKLGFKFEQSLQLAPGDPVRLFAVAL